MYRSQAILVSGIGLLTFSSMVALSQLRSTSLETLQVQSSAIKPIPVPSTSLIASSTSSPPPIQPTPAPSVSVAPFQSTTVNLAAVHPNY